MITIGCISYGIGWTIFLLPNHIGNGGVAGLSSIVFWGFNTPVYVTYLVLNSILLAAALKTLGLKFCIKTIYGVLTLTLVTTVLREIFPNPTILQDQPFMVALIGAIFCGLGLGFCLSYNGSSGGSDIVATIVNKYRDISLGRVLHRHHILLMRSAGQLGHHASIDLMHLLRCRDVAQQNAVFSTQQPTCRHNCSLYLVYICLSFLPLL